MKPELFVRAQRFFKLGKAPDAVEEALDPEAVKARRRRLVMIAGAVLVGLMAVIYVLTHFVGRSPAPVASVNATQAVTAITVGAQEFNPRITLTGEARPVRDIHVFAPASGVRVLQLLADEGDQVRAGQPLARLDTSLATAQIRNAQASVAEAQSAAQRARDEYQRAESIRDSGALSVEQINQRRAAATAADARLAAARAQQQEVNARLQGGYVRAPVAGLIISRSVQLGAMVDQQEMFRIAGGNELEVAAQIAESDVLSLRRGQSATFRLVDGTFETATLRRPPASIDSRTRTGQALFQLPARTRVRAGMFLRGEAQLAARQALAAPQSSILYENGEPYVFVIDAQNHVRKTMVRLGLRQGDSVEVTDGLTPGMRIVGAGAAFVQDGDGVRPIEPPAQQQRRASTTTAEPELRGREG